MSYYELYTEFKNLFIEKTDVLDKLEKDANAEESDGMHIMFSFVVIPFVIELLKQDDSKDLNKAFAFFEKMAASELSEITEVLEFTVIENLISNGSSLYTRSKKYMGKNTLECCRRIEQYLKVEE